MIKSRATRLGLSLLLCGAIGALLAATIYWTMFHPGWVTFLGGVLFAAVASIASNASKAEWRLARRTRQMKELRDELERSKVRGQAATRAFQAAEARLRQLGEVLRSAVIFIDDAGVCRFHNRAAAQKLQGEEPIDGRPLCELAPQTHEALLTREEVVWRTAESEQMHYAVRRLASGGETCLLVTPVEPRAAVIRDKVRVAGENGETVYLNAIARELTGWDDPKAKLTAALREDRFLLMQQRIQPLDLGAADRIGYEVLLRLQEEEDHLLPPGGFLPEAERLGMMEELDRWVVRNAIAHCLRCASAPVLYCLNLSAAAVSNVAFARYVQSQIESRKCDGRMLCFEIGEHEVIHQRAEVERLIAMLKPYGIGFTVDSFGSVRGTFAALQGLAFDFVKIDGVIVQNVLRDPAVRARLAAINAACHATDMRTIAEFVEDEATLAALRRMGVDYAQGFGIARPEPLALAAPARSRAIA